ncbi:MAG TPA: hypothetical protein ENO00_03425 [Deltaproteobacteria bacterium]|nr:hypothetical protein [Deltaproteobacteria bacterium]
MSVMDLTGLWNLRYVIFQQRDSEGIMGLLKGPVTATKYRVTGTVPDDFRNFVDERIKHFAFSGLSTGEAEKSIGWTSIDNILDTDFSYANYSIANYLIFSLRIDRKVVPTALLKLKVLEAEKELLTQRNTEKIYKAERNDLKDRIHLSLMNQTPPIPATFEVCWNVSEGWLLFGSLSEKVKEDFVDLFSRTFNLSLRPFVPWDMKYADPVTARRIASIFDAGLSGSDPIKGSEDAGGTDLSFLGRDFLTWLWFKSEERGGTVMVPDVGDVAMLFVRKLILESGEGPYSETVSCQGMHSNLTEGKSALRRGKKIKEARIKLAVGTDETEFSFKADTFQFQTLKFPPSFTMEEDENDREGRILERISIVEKGIGLMEQLFAFFLSKRTLPAWTSDEVPRMGKWMQE